MPLVPDSARADINALSDYHLRTASGQLVPLTTVVDVQRQVQAQYLPQFQQLAAVTLQGIPAPGVTLGQGLDPVAAVKKASSIRLRPILMTSVAMVLGVVPLLLATGPGAVSRFHLGLTLATGLTIGALISLYVVPVVYTYVAARRAHKSGPI